MHTGTVLMAEISTGQCLSTMQHDYQTGLYREREREAASNSQLDEQFSLFFFMEISFSFQVLQILFH